MHHTFWLGDDCNPGRVDTLRRKLAEKFLERYPGKMVAAELHGVYGARFLEAVQFCGWGARRDSGTETAMDRGVQLASDLFHDPLATAARERVALSAARVNLVEAAKDALKLVEAAQRRGADLPDDVLGVTRATIDALSSILAIPDVDAADDLVDKFVLVMKIDGFQPKLISAFLLELGYPSAMANVKAVNVRAHRLKKKHELTFPPSETEKTKAGREMRAARARTITASS